MKQFFDRNPYREMPDGTIGRAYPFHISLEGLEDRILCRDDEDYDVMTKIMAVCAYRKNTVILIYVVVSNHGHLTVLALSQEDADSCAEEIKRMYSMYYSRKYGDKSVMKGVDSKAIFIDSDFYLRNAIAYDIRNAMDNGATSIQSYPWSGFRGIFVGGAAQQGRKVCLMTKREKRQVMHTDDDLSKVQWTVDMDGHLQPASVCDRHYVEAAFLGDQAYFMKMIGGVNQAEMAQKLIVGPRAKTTDNELLRFVEDVSQRWFHEDVHALPVEKKSRIINYVTHVRRTDVPQLSRVFEIDREHVMRLIRDK